MNDSWLLTQCSKCYELVRVMNDMNDSRSSTQVSSCYEQLRVVNDMNDFMFQLKALYAMSSLELWMT